MFSYNGSQLVAASKELHDVIEGLDWKLLKEYRARYKTTGKFSPADAPWMNGAIEALVKTAKRNLSSAIVEQVLTFSELETVFFEINQLMNQRPLGAHILFPDD